MSANISKTPWVVERNFAWSKDVDVRSADDKQVAFVGSLNEADARLIAAAPLLLEALERMTGACTRYLEERIPSESEMYDPNYVGPLTQARAAIAAARGEE